MTVGELRQALRCCEDDEPVSFVFEDVLTDGKKLRVNLKWGTAGSAAGGRAVVIWFDRLYPHPTPVAKSEPVCPGNTVVVSAWKEQQ